MPAAHLDASEGVTGDMWLGAVMDAGASLEGIERAVGLLGIGDVRLSYVRVTRAGRPGVAVRVRPPTQTPRVATVRQVQAVLRYAALDDPVRDACLEVFDRYAAAVATAQDVPVDEVVFAEIGMLDDLAAIVGTCVALDHLGIEGMTVGPIGVPEGRDPDLRTRTVDHLLADFPTVPITGSRDLVTPTGAALVAGRCRPDATAESAADGARTGAGAAARDLVGGGMLHLHIAPAGA